MLTIPAEGLSSIFESETREFLSAAHPDEPLLNYVLTIYGHYPYRLNEALRPRIIEALRPALVDGELEVLLNQLHYRSEAIADYVQELMALWTRTV